MSELLDRLTNAQVQLTEAIRILQQQENGRDTPPVVQPPAPPPAVPKAIVKRVSDAPANGWAVNEYSTVCAFNGNNSAFLVGREGGFFELYDAEGLPYKLLPSEVGASSRPRWLKSPNMFTYLAGNRIRHFDIAKAWDLNAAFTLRTFAQFQSVDDGGEADISEDGDHRVLVGDDRTVFVYRISADSILGSFDATSYRKNYSCIITPDNNVLIPGPTEIKMYDRTMRFLRSIPKPYAHMDVTRDISGDECLIWPDGNDNSIHKIRLADGQSKKLLTLGWSPLGGPMSMAVHISCPDKAGFALVTTYGKDPNVKYANQILKLPLDGSEPIVLCEHHSQPFNDYHWQPKASVSRDGSRFLFSSNAGIKQTNIEWSNVFLGLIP